MKKLMLILVLALVLITFSIAHAQDDPGGEVVAPVGNVTGTLEGACDDENSCIIACYQLYQDTWTGIDYKYSCDPCPPHIKTNVQDNTGSIMVAAGILPHIKVSLNYDRFGVCVCDTDATINTFSLADIKWFFWTAAFEFQFDSNIDNMSIQFNNVKDLEDGNGNKLPTSWKYWLDPLFPFPNPGNTGWETAAQFNSTEIDIPECNHCLYLWVKFDVPKHQSAGLYRNEVQFVVNYDLTIDEWDYKPCLEVDPVNFPPAT